MELFTLGYEKRTLAEFIELLRAANINVLVDVRETAWSHKPGFSKRALQSALADAGIDYVHASFAGNPKRLRDASRSHEDCLKRYARHLNRNPQVMRQLGALLGQFHSDGRKVCLTCFERHPDDCHRGILANAWTRATNACVRHLASEGCRRLAQA